MPPTLIKDKYILQHCGHPQVTFQTRNTCDLAQKLPATPQGHSVLPSSGVHKRTGCLCRHQFMSYAVMALLAGRPMSCTHIALQWGNKSQPILPWGLARQVWDRRRHAAPA